MELINFFYSIHSVCLQQFIVKITYIVIRDLFLHFALHVWVTLIVPGCVHVCLRFAVGVGSPGVCLFHVLILMSILVLNCEVL